MERERERERQTWFHDHPRLAPLYRSLNELRVQRELQLQLAAIDGPEGDLARAALKDTTSAANNSDYPQYWHKDEIAAGIKNGTLCRGALHVSSRNPEEAWVRLDEEVLIASNCLE